VGLEQMLWFDGVRVGGIFARDCIHPGSLTCTDSEALFACQFVLLRAQMMMNHSMVASP